MTSQVASWSVESGLVVEERLKALGFAHGVTTRALGNMRAPETRDGAAALAGVPPGAIKFLKQVHGRAVWRWPAPAESLGEGDGWVADRPEAGLGVFAADCLPLFMWGPEGKAYGLAHVGWRGAAAGMPTALAEAFVAAGVDAADLSAGLGPSIRGCCYRVGPELGARFREGALRREEEGLYLDIAAEARLQLVEAGLPEASISDSGLCTHCRPEQFFSFRREKADKRMMAFLYKPRPAHG